MSTLFATPVVVGVVDSTNRFVADEARRGAPEGLVVVADHQSSGRGRKGRPWFSAPGTSLLCSMLFRPRLPLADAHLVPTIVALGARRAIEECCGRAPDCKWPNDLLVGEKKVAGILSEVVSERNGYALVCGIGVNLALPPATRRTDPGLDELLARATSLEEALGCRVDRDELLSGLLEAVGSDYARLKEAGYRDEVMARYRHACVTIGATVEVATENERFEAVALDVDDSGRLVVETGGRRRVLEAAEVVHVRRPDGSY